MGERSTVNGGEEKMTQPEFLMIWCNHPVAMFVVAIFLYISYRIYSQSGGRGPDD